MIDAFDGELGNPANASHEPGRAAARAIESARQDLASLIGSCPEQIVFTSGATEANNFALHGTVANCSKARARQVIVAAAIEHRSILVPAQRKAERDSSEVRHVPVTSCGVIDLEAFRNMLDRDVLLVCVQLANNEIGTIQPIREVVELAHEHGALVLCDATQAVGKIEINVEDLGVDLLSLSAHKFHGPKGAGALFIRDRECLVPLLSGGGQERGLRSGTPNVPAIVGMGVAARVAGDDLASDAMMRIRALREVFERELIATCRDIVINGIDAPRLPGICSVTASGRNGCELISQLDGLAISRGSACSTGSARPSHVLKALGHHDDDAFSTIRISLGSDTTDADMSLAFSAVSKALSRDVVAR